MNKKRGVNMFLKALADTALAILIAAKKNAVYLAKGAVNTVKNLAIKSAKKAKQIAYKLMHRKSLGKNPVETTTNLGDINHLGHSGLKRNIREAKFGKVDIINQATDSEVDDVTIQVNKNKLNENIDIQGEIQRGLREMELSDEIESLTEENTSEGYRIRNSYVSSVDLKIRTEENNKKIKDKVAQFIIDAIEDDIHDYNRDSYILNPEEIIDFVNECKEEAFKRVKEDVVNQMVDKIKLSL